jgi:hypothetical protein
MAILLHALAALVLGNFRFASFLERAHSGIQIASLIQPSNPQRRNPLLSHWVWDSWIRKLFFSIFGFDST